MAKVTTPNNGVIPGTTVDTSGTSGLDVPQQVAELVDTDNVPLHSGGIVSEDVEDNVIPGKNVDTREDAGTPLPSEQ